LQYLPPPHAVLINASVHLAPVRVLQSASALCRCAFSTATMILVRRLALLLTAFTAPTYATCYNPNGSVAADDIPCQPSQSNSTCCGSGLACLSNNLCGITQFPSNPKKTFGLGEWFVRGSCTDKTFTSSACFKRCLRSATGDLYSLFTPVRQCLAGSRDRWYCSNAQTRDQSLDEVCFALNSTDEFVFQMDGMSRDSG
jgi:hypothetical protein